MSIVDVPQLQRIAEVEFVDIVTDTVPGLNQLRILLEDGSYVDVWFSLKLEGRYSYHWERKAIDGTIYRHDNAPHQRWQHVRTFPKHFHDGREDDVTESHLSDEPADSLREFLMFVRTNISSTGNDAESG
ncbi:MAG: DUF6516 family protein [Salinibacter sp.]